MPKVEIFETKDGSHSLLLPEMNETYHSTHGAITEAQYVFLEKGLAHYRERNPDQQVIRVLEIGFGTGLNAWLTALETNKSMESLVYTSLEKYPLAKEVTDQLNYVGQLGDENGQEVFDRVHAVAWNEQQKITELFSLIKVETDVFQFEVEEAVYDLIFFDAFAPSKQPEMWSPEVLAKMYQGLAQNGVLVTYCAQGQFKRDIKSAGFEIEELPGPPGKKEMTRATKR
ncbi:tRNA U34 5-methylaminomethyl-2-thiouridine-forming methyltransferase MnmC [Reichenbachiella agariperforans]|uniref:tRNA U34 5-methylaminomethyl-2-thiouridine-forming methyltransferase MnmC n=1 Tax=Reichenbachiella agariperforans TaxID=156994 RepID=A0A1M6TJZ0_REIAG|nr:tRNA (5-methylaminomethyl-2-thiouridine)(34)-methyltransferase MnmD [Reichenbachiella agariperforans]SHK57250.1 tRNA U34 5-methylaminomethyl-2-thiouridine-forming methyltransferase MnmC [Reichenbachiella agariperforans]